MSGSAILQGPAKIFVRLTRQNHKARVHLICKTVSTRDASNGYLGKTMFNSKHLRVLAIKQGQCRTALKQDKLLNPDRTIHFPQSERRG